MPITDFYEGATKKFNVNILVSGSAPDITNDTVTFLMNISGSTTADASGSILSSSADVASSGSVGVAIFNLTPQFTIIEENIYTYELYWFVSASADENVIEIGEVSVLPRVKVV